MKFKKLFTFLLTIIFCINLIFNNISYASTTTFEVDAPSCILMHADTGKIIYEKNAYEKMYPASTTKIMTAILALENRELTDIAIVSYDAIFSVPSGYSNANLQIGEELTFEQLLHILLIPSANDAANVIAEEIAGSTESFATMMNTRAQELGCVNTHFTNPSGIHDENHYSCAYDLAIMGQYAMQNDTFRKIVSTVMYTLPVTNKYDKADRIFLTTNKFVNSKSDEYYKYATGLKTGYTVPAKNCIVASAKKDDLEFISVILGADNTVDSNKFIDSRKLFEYGFNNYSIKTLCTINSVYKVVKPKNSSKNTNSLNVLFESNLDAIVNNNNLNLEYSPEVELDKNLRAPITKGSVIGKVSYTIDDIKYTTNLIAGQDIEANSIFTIIFRIILVIFILYIIARIIRYKNKKRYKKKKSSYKNNKEKNYSSPYLFKFE